MSSSSSSSAASVRYQQFHEADIVTVRVEAPETSRAAR